MNVKTLTILVNQLSSHLSPVERLTIPLQNSKLGPCQKSQLKEKLKDPALFICADIDGEEISFSAIINLIEQSEITATVSKEWAKLFLSNWNRAVELWDAGELFVLQKTIMQEIGQSVDQQEYARICCAWMIPNRFSEPHVEASNIHPDCSCLDCILGPEG